MTVCAPTFKATSIPVGPRVTTSMTLGDVMYDDVCVAHVKILSYGVPVEIDKRFDSLLGPGEKGRFCNSLSAANDWIAARAPLLVAYEKARKQAEGELHARLADLLALEESERDAA